jgi:hypothetical protein
VRRTPSASREGSSCDLARRTFLAIASQMVEPSLVSMSRAAIADTTFPSMPDRSGSTRRTASVGALKRRRLLRDRQVHHIEFMASSS